MPIAVRSYASTIILYGGSASIILSPHKLAGAMQRPRKRFHDNIRSAVADVAVRLNPYATADGADVHSNAATPTPALYWFGQIPDGLEQVSFSIHVGNVFIHLWRKYCTGARWSSSKVLACIQRNFSPQVGDLLPALGTITGRLL